MFGFLSRFVDSNDRELKRIAPVVDAANELEPELLPLSDDEIRARFEEPRGGKIAEAKPGEGKPLVAPLAAILNAMTGRGVHIVTVNDYLARRDPQWMGPISP